jgi:signal transduction histidine kinase
MRAWRRLSLRGRLMLLGTGGLVVGLAIGGIALVTAMSYALQRTADTDALSTADTIVQMIETDGALPQPVPVPAGQIAQVLDGNHLVLGGSAQADKLLPILKPNDLTAVERGARLNLGGDTVGQLEPIRVLARVTGPAQPAADRRIVVVAISVGGFQQSVALLRTALLILYPLLLLLLVGVGWRVVGGALAPVETLRAGAERITGAATAERLPVPPSHDEIHRLAATLNDMLDRLAAGRARQRAFVADAAHELRSPLASMRIQLEVAQRLRDWDTVSDDLLAEVERLSRLVDDLLTLARADHEARPSSRPGRPTPVEPVELQSLLREVAARYGTARVPVNATLHSPLWTEGNADDLRRVLVNLVDNGVRHARTGVTLAAEAEGPYALMTVVDDGRGISPVDRERVFDRFTRLDDARARDGGGAGLGLAIVRELVRRHRGTVCLEDARPGVRAEVRLPRLSAAGEPHVLGRTEAAGAGATASHRAHTASGDLQSPSS